MGHGRLFLENLSTKMPKDVFYEEFVVKQRMITDIADQYSMDHRVLSELRKYYGFDKIKRADRTYHIDLENEEHKEALQVLYGTLLGDGHLSYNPGKYLRLELKHGIRQIEWLTYKRNIIDKIIDMSTITEAKQSKYSFVGAKPCFRAYSMSCTWLVELYESLYDDNRRKFITYDYLNKLDELAVATWILDDGCYSHSKQNDYYQLATNCFTEEEHKIIKQWFKDKFNIDCNYFLIKGREGNQHNLTFTKTSSQYLKDFLRLIIKDVPSMAYKIGEGQFKSA